ncbi:glucose transporter lmgt3 [Leptomonas pyrrhocoris]|uniref:Glucose transporter lmgt3 n=1 Tax=Leptomonas pyrrhocoris TaxID=157538 RepID=A0A0M9FQ49_LEPPY|nr:glucose transporter lmgt3 [Leptomonas pyrrhocoris]XP_015652235.1 glucose transporter lmgt3 [Leptomonas pyrrhocoris]KPA73795.1 glucose transporter lmgt3 [Leptomonas pyrrhocoris]KPA73796.1 glucose transporter lmgt3 [Leptomonas pyrrhocoris]|eukprot:XP_015652234.1 glucose transporter lmgt3 [Leptomonas pyrrhocoris]
MYIMGTDCSLYRGGRTACETLPYSDCKWFDDDAGGYCGWYTITCRKQYAWGNSSADFIPETVARSACLADKRCTWSYSDQQCENPAGLTTGNHGLFAGSQVVGSCIGAFLASMLVPRIGSRISFVIIGMMQFMCCVMKYVSCAEDEFWVLIPARFVIGLSLGLTSVACPLYVDQNAHPAHKRQLGSLYQTFTSVGQLIEATMALGVGQSIWVDTNKDQHVMGRIQSLVGCLMVISIFMICLGIFSKETRAKFNNEKAEDAVQLNANEFSYRKMLPRLMMGTVIACTLQMTGINAINNFAPTIMGNLGVAPLVGNFIVIAWNLVTAIASFPLVSRFSMRRLFLTGALFISCMCMFLCGIPVYPGVTKSTPAKHGVAIAGILLFVMGYELAVAPCYFVLTQDLFPPSFRPRGASWTQVSMYIFNVIINVCFPIAVEDLSGGPSGNQDKGESIVFMFFGGIGLICLVLEYCFLHPWEDGPAGTLPAPEKSESHKTPPHADNEPHTIELDVYHDSNNSSR